MSLWRDLNPSRTMNLSGAMVFYSIHLTRVRELSIDLVVTTIFSTITLAVKVEHIGLNEESIYAGLNV